MRNDNKISKRVVRLAEKLPCFSIENFKLAGITPEYLKIFLARYAKKGQFIRIKRGLYTNRAFIEKMKAKNKYSEFIESLATEAYSPSYLSLEYILYQNNLITEVPINFTLISKNKTAVFNNELGNFFYHKIKDDLFMGFKTVKSGEFLVRKATKAKALFDFLYLRKNLLGSKDEINELRLNLEELSLKDRKELRGYIDLEGSKKIKEIYGKLGID